MGITRHAVTDAEDEEHQASRQGRHVLGDEPDEHREGPGTRRRDAQPGAKKTPRAEAPMKAEYWKRPIEK